MEAVRDGRMGTNTAGRTFEVPPSTLKDRFSIRVRHGSKPGPAPYLDEAEEDELVQFLMKSAAMEKQRESFLALWRKQ